MSYKRISPIPVIEGGTGDVTLTNHGVLIGAGTSAVTPLAVGATGTVLIGNTAADPSFSASPTLSGNLNLPNTNTGGTAGEITFGGNRWVSNFGTDNTFVGEVSGNTTVTGTDNSAFGFNAFNGLTTGSNDVAVGSGAFSAATTLNNSVAVGYQAAHNMVVGGNDVAIGAQAMFTTASSGGGNVAVGFIALQNVTGALNIGIGQSSLNSLTSGSYNIALGYTSGIALTTSESSNICISNTGVTGDNNTIRLGTDGTGTGQQSSCFTAGALTSARSITATTGNVTATLGDFVSTARTNSTLTTGSFNIGGSAAANTILHAFDNNAGGTSNVFVGFSAGNPSAMTNAAINNTGIGKNALNALTTGASNTAVGLAALQVVTTDSFNTAVGRLALSSLSGSSIGINTAIGHNALATCSTGNQNTALGGTALGSISSGSRNVGIGIGGGSIYQTGNDNIVISNNGTASGTSGEIKIGTTGTQTTCFIAGIASVSVANTNMVTINTSTGQLGSQAVPTGVMPWTVVTAATQAIAVNNGYIANNAGTCVMTLPATSAVGDIIRVSGMNNATGWQIAQRAGQTIHFGSSNTATGTGGSLTSAAIYDAVELVCNIANTDFIVLSSVGNITVA